MDEILQGTPEWHALRLGRVTASRIADVTAKIKTGVAASRTNYMAELVAERLTGKPTEGFTSGPMEWGTNQQDDARLAYAFRVGAEVAQIAFVPHPRIPMSGASPDGLVGPDGLVEFKCPNTATHIDTLLSGTVPGKYEKQMLWQLACTGRDWCDFVSYDPRLPHSMQMFVKRYDRDGFRIAELEREIVEFLGEVDATVAALREKFAMRVAA